MNRTGGLISPSGLVCWTDTHLASNELPPSSRLRGSERGFWHLCHGQFLTNLPHHPCRCLIAVDHTNIRQRVCTLAQALLPDLARHGTGLARLMLAWCDLSCQLPITPGGWRRKAREGRSASRR